MYAIAGIEPGFIEYKLEESDGPEIATQIIGYMEDSLELPPNPFTVTLIEPIFELEVDLDINPFKHITKRHCKKCLNQLRKLT